MKNIRLTVKVNEEDDGMLWGEVAELPGCFVSGKDLDELQEALHEAVNLYVQDLSPEDLAKLPVDVPDNVVHPPFGKKQGPPSDLRTRVNELGMLIEA